MYKKLTSSEPTKSYSEKQARLSEALRENLKRRKQSLSQRKNIKKDKA